MFRRCRAVCFIATLLFFLIASGAVAAGEAAAAPVVINSPEVHWPAGAEQWEVSFQVITGGEDGWKARLVSVEVDQKPVDMRRLKFKGITNFEVPVVNVGKWVAKEELEALQDWVREAGKGREPGRDKAELAHKARRALIKMGEREPGVREVALDFKEAVAGLGIETGEVYPVRATFEAVYQAGETATLTLETTAAVLDFPSLSGWFHGDLHAHSIFSDGNQTIEDLRKRFEHEYDFMYLTDHSDKLWGKWDDYIEEGKAKDGYKKTCENYSDYQFSFFPGVEVTGISGGDPENAEGDVLAYGVKDLNNLENRAYSCQEAIDNINNNDPGRSTSSIAHPYDFLIPWEDWTVVRHHGFELMSGMQIDCSLSSRPVARWRSELARCINDTFDYSYRPSARTGTDFHYWFLPCIPYHTWVYLPADWKTLDYEDKKYQMDLSLKEGRTSVSRMGSLVTFSVNDKPIGTILKGVPEGTNLHFYVWFCPNLRDEYTVRVYDEKGTQVGDARKYNFRFKKLEPVSFEFDLPARSGRHFYWIYVEGASGIEYAYTSPIYVSGERQEIDVVFVIDTTGSMWDDIASVKAAATDIVNALDSTTSDYRVAVVDYRDFPVSPYGGQGDYDYHVMLPFSADRAAIIDAIQGLSIGWGGDWKESVYSALTRAIYTEGIGPWRENVKKVVILMGDAPPHDPEPFTGYTLDSVVAAAESVDPAVIYSIAIGGDPTTYAYFSRLANRTGGRVFTAPTSSDIVRTILEAIGGIGGSPGENRPPDCSGATASISRLWPPNHKMVEIRILNVTDPDGDPVTISITGITQDEPVKGLGSDDKSPDGSGVGTGAAMVRAERSGEGNGRVYKISFTASDGKGGVSCGSVLVGVPHDQGINTVVIDDGQNYDSTAE